LTSKYNALKEDYELTKSKLEGLETTHQLTLSELSVVKSLMYTFLATTLAFAGLTVYLALTRKKLVRT
jgi:hypothetical protein